MLSRLIVASFLVLLCCGFSFGQDVAELAIIRSLLGVPQNTPITSTSSAAVPNDTPLKVYFDVSGDAPERDKKVKDRMVQWLSELTVGDKDKRIRFEIVSDPGDARLSLIHFTDFPTEVLDPGGDADRGDSRMGQTGVASFSSTVKMSMMVHTYIIVKEVNLLKIIYRRKVPVSTWSTIVAGAQLTNAVTARMRKEIDKEVEKRALKSNAEKDAKRPDLKLRDEFARWIASADRPTMNH